MFKKQDKIAELLDKTIIEIHTDLNSVTSDSDEYSKMADQLEKLHNLRNASSDKLDKNTKWIVIGNLAGIGMIIGYERSNLLASKAFSLIRQLK